jgi:PTS system nitrogen regulatory IIA component
LKVLNLSQVADLLDTKEEIVNRWLRQGVIPFHTSSGNVWFNEAEIRSWAACVQLRTQEPNKRLGETGDLLIDALHRGGVFHQLPANNRDSFLHQMTALAQLPAHVNREKLLQVLRQREAMSSTGLGNGVAIPHPANPALLRLKEPHLACFFPKEPVPFDAPDRVPVFVAFLILASDSANHLRLLGQIARLLKEDGFLNLLANRPSEETMTEWLVEWTANES